MRALSLTQPWATLIALGEKRIETRSWGTPYRGPILIHAAKSLSGVGGVTGLHDACEHIDEIRDALAESCDEDPNEICIEWQFALPRGVIVAVAELVDVQVMTAGWIHAQEQIRPAELPLGFYEPGRRAWILDEVRALADPVVCNGQQLGGGRVTAQGLWTPPADVVEQVTAAVPS